MKKSIFLICLIKIFFLSSLSLGEEDIDSVLKNLKSSNFLVRSEAFYKLGKIGYTSSKAKDALIELVLFEDKLNPRAEFGEFIIPQEIQNAECVDAYSSYIRSLCDVMTKIDNEKIFPYFFRVLSIPTEQRKEYLVNKGERTLPYMFKSVDNGNLASIEILGEMLKEKKNGYVARGEVREKIKQVLIELLDKYKNPETSSMEETKLKSISLQNATSRMFLIRALGVSGDPDVVSIIEKVAKEDPYKIKYDDGIEHYPVRETAQRTLQLMKEGKYEEILYPHKRQE